MMLGGCSSPWQWVLPLQLPGWDADTKGAWSPSATVGTAGSLSLPPQPHHSVLGSVHSWLMKTSRATQKRQTNAVRGGSAHQDPVLAKQGRHVPWP